jgi:PAS domain-containing protein
VGNAREPVSKTEARGGTASAPPTDAETLLSALFDQRSLAIAVVEASGRLTVMSRGLHEILGSSVHGVPISELPRMFHLFDAEDDRIPITRRATDRMGAGSRSPPKQLKTPCESR